MKIALVIERFDAKRGGAEAFCVWLAGELAQRGHEVHVVCHDVAARVNRYRVATHRASHDADRSHGALPPDEVMLEGVQTHRIRGMKLSSGLGFRLFGRAARRCCARLQPEVTHSLTVAFPGDIYHSQAGVYAEIQAQAVASRSTDAAANFKRLMLRLSGKQRALLALERRAVSPDSGGPRPARIVSLSRIMTEQLVRHYGADASVIVELPNPRLVASDARPWDESRAAEERAWFRGHYGIGTGDRVAAFVGHDFRRKGLRYAIEAVAQTRTCWKLLVVGLGKVREYVELAPRLGLGAAAEGGAEGARVVFVGPTREVDAVYAASDALLLPTFYDSFGLVVVEALAHGLPVISTELLGAGDLVKACRAGTIVPGPRDVAAMARALDELPAHGSAEQEALAQRARSAGGGMAPGRYVERILELYETVRTAKAARAAGR